MSHNPLRNTQGPFTADQLKSGDPYELDNGHPIECLPSGGRHSKANLTGGLVLGTDPDVDEAGVDTGYSSDPKNLRAPDIAVGNVPDRPGWVEGAPPLAVEYADVGQDESELEAKIATLLDSGTRWVWVVRMRGPRRVEVHAAGGERQVFGPGDALPAPGVLRNPVPVEALYDPGAAQQAALRNLLQRHGYADLAEVRSEGHVAGHAEGQAEATSALVMRQLRHRLGSLSSSHEERVSELSLEQLLLLGDALLDFASAHDLDSWLVRTLG